MGREVRERPRVVECGKRLWVDRPRAQGTSEYIRRPCPGQATPAVSASAAATASGLVDCGVLLTRTDAAAVTCCLHVVAEQLAGLRAIRPATALRSRALPPAAGAPSRRPLRGPAGTACRATPGSRRRRWPAAGRTRRAPCDRRCSVRLPIDGRGRVERHGERVLGVEHRLLVLLQILVVAGRQALHRHQQAGEVADRAAGLAAHQLERIGILLLRHHAAAGGRRIGQLEEPELLARDQDEVLGDARQVHHRRATRRAGSVAAKSRSDDASMLLATTREKPSASASERRCRSA